MEEDRLIPGMKVLMIGGSAGSIDVLMKILPGLSPFSSYAIVIVLHRKSSEDKNLEELIALKTNIPVVEVEDKVAFRHGFIYVAPSDYHLLFEKNNLLSLDISEKVNYSRPSIDVSFESAAEVFGPGITAILLSGANADGTAGLAAIKKMGGTVVVQDPSSAEMPFMPANAIENIQPDLILNVDDIIRFISSDFKP